MSERNNQVYDHIQAGMREREEQERLRRLLRRPGPGEDDLVMEQAQAITEPFMPTATRDPFSPPELPPQPQVVNMEPMSISAQRPSQPMQEPQPAPPEEPTEDAAPQELSALERYRQMREEIPEPDTDKDDGLDQALAEKRRMSRLAMMMEGAGRIGAGIAGTQYEPGTFDSIAQMGQDAVDEYIARRERAERQLQEKRAEIQEARTEIGFEEKLNDIEERREDVRRQRKELQNEQDPESEASRLMQQIAQRMGVNVGNRSAKDIKQAMPMLGNIYQQEMSSRERELDRIDKELDRRARREDLVMKLEADRLQKSQGKNIPKAQEEADKRFIRDWVDFADTGGFAGVQKDLKELEGSIEILEKHKGPKAFRGPRRLLTGAMGSAGRTVLMPQFENARRNVEAVTAQNLKLILGGQFTEKQHADLMDKAFSSFQAPEENIRRVNNLIDQIKRAAQAKQDAHDYFQKHGTLWEYERPRYTRMEDFMDAMDTVRVQVGNRQAEVPKSKVDEMRRQYPDLKVIQ